MNHTETAKQILLDNPVLEQKIIKATGLDRAEIPEILSEVLRFMQMINLSAERLTPSNLVDLAWHEFILFTKYYADFCQKHFGGFIHHHPGGLEGENRLAFKKSHYFYQKYFGKEPNPKYWGRVLAEIADESDCGAS
jgi:hypothetical protein